MSADADAARESHRLFLNRYYGWSRRIYDVTRRYYLLGRDRVLAELSRERWKTLIEVGPGTGRNLELLHKAKPDARIGGIDASDAMLEVARRRCRYASLTQGFAEDADYRAVLGDAPDRILFSYCLSMVQDPERAVSTARRALAPGGRLVIVDFADGAGLPNAAQRALRAWLKEFHVQPVDTDWLEAEGGHLRFGAGRYWFSASLAAWRQRDSAD